MPELPFLADFSWSVRAQVTRMAGICIASTASLIYQPAFRWQNDATVRIATLVPFAIVPSILLSILLSRHRIPGLPLPLFASHATLSYVWVDFLSHVLWRNLLQDCFRTVFASLSKFRSWTATVLTDPIFSAFALPDPVVSKEAMFAQSFSNRSRSITRKTPEPDRRVLP